MNNPNDDVVQHNGNDNIQSRDDLIEHYFHCGYSHKEMLAFLTMKHGLKISLVHLKRLLKALGLQRRGVESPIENIVDALQEELRGRSQCLGYRAMTHKLITDPDHRLIVKRETVRRLLKLLDPEGVQSRQKHKLRRRVYISAGPNYLIHMDGYDKIKPYGFAIHGAIDGYSRRILWLRVAVTNNNPEVIASYYINYIKEIKGVPRVVRADHGTENTTVEDVQVALRWNHNDEMAGPKSFVYGKSTSNQRVERMWGLMRLSGLDFYISLFKDLVARRAFSPSNDIQRECIRFCYMDVIQNDLDSMSREWNEHRIRPCHYGECPPGKPNVLFHLPELYESQDYKQMYDEEHVEEAQNNLCYTPPSCHEGLAQAFRETTQHLGCSMPSNSDEALDLYGKLCDTLHL